MNPLPKSYYQTDDLPHMAQSLLGKIIKSKIDGAQVIGRIVETEAYRSSDDKGSHAYPDKVTKRTEVQFAAGGNAYIYLCYGIHHLFNIITGPAEAGHVVLIRAVELIEGESYARHRRNIKVSHVHLTNGPGKWTQAFGITTDLNNCSLYSATGQITVLDAPKIPRSQIIASPRVGIAYAQECASWPWRFRIKNSIWTSKPDQVFY